MNGGAWLHCGSERVDVILRDLNQVEYWTQRAEQGEFEVDHLLGYLAGVPTYLLTAELASCRVLHGNLNAIPFPAKLASSAPSVWRFCRSFSLEYARMHARRGNRVGAAGQVAKAANQIMVAAQMAAMGELLRFSQKSGVNPKKVVLAIKDGAARCWTLDVKPQRLFSGNRAPGFKAYMQAKDMRIVLETAREYGMPLPVTAATTQLFEAMLQMNMAELDNSAVIGVLEAMAGTQLQENS